MQITALGDCALIVRVRNRFEDVPEETLVEVLATLDRLKSAHIPGVIELAPAYTSVAIFFDPLRVMNDGVEPDRVIELLIQQIGEQLSRSRRARHKDTAGPVIEIPVCYDLEFGPDLDDVARHAQLSNEEVVELHSGVEYRVSCIGFVPGFPFLAGLPKRLTTPRRSTPRKEVPLGSVGIGGAQTGIYPLRSPGGWNLIGRTPLKLFDPTKDPPALLRAGDRVRFRTIAREEFDSMKQ